MQLDIMDAFATHRAISDVLDQVNAAMTRLRELADATPHAEWGDAPYHDIMMPLLTASIRLQHKQRALATMSTSLSDPGDTDR